TPVDEEVWPRNVMASVVLVRKVEQRKSRRDVSPPRHDHAPVPPHIGNRQVLAEVEEETLGVLEVVLGSLQVPEGPLQQPTVVAAAAFHERVALPPERRQHAPVPVERLLGATKQLEDVDTVHLERSSIGSAEHTRSQVGLAEGLRGVPPKGKGP